MEIEETFIVMSVCGHRWRKWLTTERAGSGGGECENYFCFSGINRDDRHMQQARKRVAGCILEKSPRARSAHSNVRWSLPFSLCQQTTKPSDLKLLTLVFFLELNFLILFLPLSIGICCCQSLKGPTSSPRMMTSYHSGLNPKITSEGPDDYLV